MPDQRSLTDQIVELRKYAIRFGLYDADDWLASNFPWRNLQGEAHPFRGQPVWVLAEGEQERDLSEFLNQGDLT